MTTKTPMSPTADPQQRANAIRDAAANCRQLAEVGRHNAVLIRSKFRQRDYGDKLAAPYENLLESKRPDKVA
jgi:hypothetical protein